MYGNFKSEKIVWIFILSIFFFLIIFFRIYALIALRWNNNVII